MIPKTSSDGRCFFGKKTIAVNVAIMSKHLSVFISARLGAAHAGIGKQHNVSGFTLFMAGII
jgi:hypothetical protein